MVLIFTFLLVAGLEIAHASDEPATEPIPVETPEEPDVCVGCDEKKETEELPPSSQITVEIIIDPVTGSVSYIIKGITIDQ